MKIVFTNRAKTDLSNIVEYIAKDDISAAGTLKIQIMQTLSALSEHPKHGRPGRVKDTRELVVHRSYIAVYQIRKDNIEILTIRHTSRLWPVYF